MLTVSCDASSTLVFLLLLSESTDPKGSADDLTVAVKVAPFKWGVKENLIWQQECFTTFGFIQT